MNGKRAEKDSRVSRVRQRYHGHRQLAMFGFESQNRYENPPFLSDNEEWRLANIAEYGIDLVHLPTSKRLDSFGGSPCAVEIHKEIPYSPDKVWVALTDIDENTVQICWNPGPEFDYFLHELDGLVSSIAFSPDSTRVAVAMENGKIAQWLVQSEYTLSAWPGPVTGKTVLCYNRDGSRILSGSADGSIRLLDARSGDVLTEIQPPDKTPVIALSMNKYGSHFLAAASDNHARLWSSDGILMDNIEGPFSTLSHVYLDAMGRYTFLQDDWLGAGLFRLEWR